MLRQRIDEIMKNEHMWFISSLLKLCITYIWHQDRNTNWTFGMGERT